LALLSASVAGGLVCLWLAQAPSAEAYPYYLQGGVGCGQAGCHTEFLGGNGVLHSQHRNILGITTCNACHPSGGGTTPVETFRSGAGGGFGCAGCHGRDYGENSVTDGQPKATGYGLREAHANAGVNICSGCHAPGLFGFPNPFPPILPESAHPIYYDLGISILADPCSSIQEDLPFDPDSLGLDNDGDGLRDYPADPDCPMPTTTTTTTTLPAGCAVAPVGGCVAPGKALLSVNEKAAGKEKIKVSLAKLQSALTPGDFGDPVAGSTSYAVCIYDDLDQLVTEISVARAGEDCGSKPCFSAVSTKGYKYTDKLTAADGVLKMILFGGDLDKGKVLTIGKNNAAKSQTSLPIGTAAALQNNTQATVQVLTNNAACFSATLTDVKKADGVSFSAKAP